MKVYGLSCLRHLQRLIYFLISIVSVFRSLNDLVGHKDSLGLLNAVQRIRQQTDAGMANRILVLAHMGENLSLIHISFSISRKEKKTRGDRGSMAQKEW